MKWTLLLLLLFPLLPPPAQAQAGTDLILVEWQALHQDSLVFTRLTDRDGYDNQPFFTPDGAAVLYTSGRGEQTDVYHRDLATGATTPLTDTPESEYSPTPLPDGGFSVVRVEPDERQRLWRFDADGTAPSLLLESVEPVGYHAWADAHRVALFILGDPPTLHLADVRMGTSTPYASNIGRSLHRVPGSTAISFVHKQEDGVWIVKMLDPDTGSITPVAATLPEREDYAWLPDGTLLMADGAVLYHWTPKQATWHPLADFSAAGIAQITRLAASPDGARVVLVIDR